MKKNIFLNVYRIKSRIFILTFILLFLFISSAYSGQSLTLKSGFNFISFTGAVSYTVDEFKALNSSIEDIYLYSPSAGSFLSAGEKTLERLYAGKGYIIKNSSALDIILNVEAGAIGVIGDIVLKPGFNLAGFSKMPKSVKFTELMAGQPEIKGMYKWSPDAGTFFSVLRNSSGIIEIIDSVDPCLKAGESYFINMTKELPLNYDGSSVVIGTPAAELKIAFVSDRNGRNEIYTMNLSGSNQVKISNHSTAVHSPAISPDGAKVAYVLENSGKYDVYVMNIDGSNVKQLTSDGESSWPAWSYDGSRLAYSKNMTEIWTMNSDGSAQSKINVTLPSNMDRLGSPSWSPDGAKIAVTGFYSTSSNIFYINVSDSSLHQLTYNIGMNMGPQWSPDGSKLVFGNNRNVELDSVYTIYVIDSNGNNQKELNSSHIDSFSAKYSWSPDGTKIAFSEMRANDSNYNQVYIMNTDGSNQIRLTEPAEKNNSAPSFPGR